LDVGIVAVAAAISDFAASSKVQSSSVFGDGLQLRIRFGCRVRFVRRFFVVWRVRAIVFLLGFFWSRPDAYPERLHVAADE
jgi:hypothetical protein